MLTLREWKIVGIMILLFVFYSIVDKVLFSPMPQTEANNTEVKKTEIEQRVAFSKELSNSPMSATTRNVLNVLSGTTTEAFGKIISQPPFIGVTGDLTQQMIKSKFIPVSGSVVDGVGGQIFILFPESPNYVYRVSFGLTNSTSTPLALVSFQKANDTKEVINSFLNDIKPYLNDTELGR